MGKRPNLRWKLVQKTSSINTTRGMRLINSKNKASIAAMKTMKRKADMADTADTAATPDMKSCSATVSGSLWR